MEKIKIDIETCIQLIKDIIESWYDVLTDWDYKITHTENEENYIDIFTCFYEDVDDIEVFKVELDNWKLTLIKTNEFVLNYDELYKEFQEMPIIY